MPGLPGSDSGAQPGSTGSSNGDGDIAGGRQDSSGGAAGDDPFGDLGNPGAGGMTAAQRRAALDARLEEGYAVFDGMILSERERVQAEADAAGSSVMGAGAGEGGDGGEGDGSATGDSGEAGSPVIIASAEGSSTGGGHLPGGEATREGEYSAQNQPSFPVPEDIPDGNDDDVVGRQLREAAMREPDPVLREKLWDEYRKYTGLSQ